MDQQRLARCRPAVRKTLDHTVHTTSGSAAASDQRHPVRHRQQLPGRHGDPLGVPAAGEQRAHLVADRPARRRLAERLDDPAHLEPGDVRRARRRWVVALALQEVGAVDARGDDVDEHLAGPGRGGVDVREDERFGAAELGEA